MSNVNQTDPLDPELRRQMRLEEYISLRQEMIQWQSRRYQILGLSSSVVPLFVGGALTQADQWEWPLPAIAVLIIISIANLTTWMMNHSIIMGGAYIEVFLQGEWELRNRRFRHSVVHPKMAHVFALSYLLLGVISTLALYLRCGQPTIDLEHVNSDTLMVGVFLLSGIWFLFTILILAFRSSPRNRYVKSWEKVKREIEAAGGLHA